MYNDNVRVLDAKTSTDGSLKLEVLEFENLGGFHHVSMASNLYYARRNGVKLHQIKATLNEGSFTVEQGALQYLRGRIALENSVGGMTGMAQRFLSSALTKEAAFRPTYTGTGEIYLEPSFGHYAIIPVANQRVVLDKGIYFAGDASLKVSSVAQKNASSALFGGEGLFQTEVAGAGLLVIHCPVPLNEIHVVELQNDRLQVDGTFAFARIGDISFSVERSAKSIVGSVTSGDGLLQTFEGTGQVWLAPTLPIYESFLSPYPGKA
ncbi:AIM24 family protein [Aneurinibacillus sp. REN35]|uniref:AIM24 family protein n=1 Tax=Aneurinibacillus sp. REN35 TaxID=3237286 RepID=UPI003527238F